MLVNISAILLKLWILNILCERVLLITLCLLHTFRIHEVNYIVNSDSQWFPFLVWLANPPPPQVNTVLDVTWCKERLEETEIKGTKYEYLAFEILIAVRAKISLWDLRPCSLVYHSTELHNATEQAGLETTLKI
jgi:hypothetical protein